VHERFLPHTGGSMNLFDHVKIICYE